MRLTIYSGKQKIFLQNGSFCCLHGLSGARGSGRIILSPGESICLEQEVYHRFYGERGRGKVLVGEVSAVNDDTSDNCFLEEIGRFPVIDEDEEPLHLLVSDYPKFLKNESG